MYQVELTNDEAQALLNMIDQAIRAGGLAAANNGLLLARKIESSRVIESTNGAGEEANPEVTQDNDGTS